MIPTFILINQLHMVNTVWAILIPGAFNVWNMILARTYYQSIPAELREASAIDGANEIQHFFKIMMPVCKPIIAVLALWSFVGMWNSYFDAQGAALDEDEMARYLAHATAACPFYEPGDEYKIVHRQN